MNWYSLALNPLRKTGLIFVTVVLVSGLGLVFYEVQSLTSSEALIESVYNRQLDNILFSVNSRIWSTMEEWTGALDKVVREPEPENSIHAFLRETRPVKSIFYGDIDRLNQIRMVGGASGAGLPPDLIPKAAETGHELIRLHSAGYRKIQPIGYVSRDEQVQSIVLFPMQAPGINVGGMAVDVPSFLQRIVVPQLREVARESLAVAVFRKGQTRPVFSNGRLESERAHTVDLWVFPEYTLAIAAPGAGIQAILRARFNRNLILVLLLAFSFLAAAAFFYRSVERESELARIKSDFLANVSHELRTPLALIHLYAETLEMGRVKNSTKLLEYYRIITHETDRLSRLVNNLLNFSKIDAGKKKYDFKLLELNDIVRQVIEMYRFHLERNGFSLETHLLETPSNIQGDREAICEAVLNLVDNAMKYSGDARLIEIGTDTDDEGGVIITVRDHGIGIPREEQARIFEQFYRVGDSLVHTVKGTGLGLALVKHIVDAHGGNIRLESTPGTGSTFTLTFRRLEAPVSVPNHQPLTSS